MLVFIASAAAILFAALLVVIFITAPASVSSNLISSVNSRDYSDLHSEAA